MAARCNPPTYRPVKFSEFGDILTPQEAAVILHCTAGHINHLCNIGEIQASKFGKYWRIPKKALTERFGDYYGRED